MSQRLAIYFRRGTLMPGRPDIRCEQMGCEYTGCGAIDLNGGPSSRQEFWIVRPLAEELKSEGVDRYAKYIEKIESFS